MKSSAEEEDSLAPSGIKIAITGKGGSGKTVLAALMTKLLAQSGELRVLAIDADSTLSLPYTLGIPITKTVGDLRKVMIEDPEARAIFREKHIREVMAEALEHGGGFDMLVMGRPEGPGCYCSVNDLLKYGIDGLSKQFDITIIDCEAGPEQVNRRVVEGIDILIIVTDPTMRGLHAADVINKVAQSHETIKAFLVINKAQDNLSSITKTAQEWGLDIIGSIPLDEQIREYDLNGTPLLNISQGSPSLMAVQGILKKLDLAIPKVTI